MWYHGTCVGRMLCVGYDARGVSARPPAVVPQQRILYEAASSSCSAARCAKLAARATITPPLALLNLITSPFLLSPSQRGVQSSLSDMPCDGHSVLSGWNTCFARYMPLSFSLSLSVSLPPSQASPPQARPVEFGRNVAELRSRSARFGPNPTATRLSKVDLPSAALRTQFGRILQQDNQIWGEID